MKWLQLQSLRTRLFSLVLLTLTPAIGLHVSSALQKRDLARQASENNLKSITNLAAANVQSLLESADEALHGLSTLPEIVAMSPGAAAVTLRQSRDIFPNFSAIALLRPDGSVLASSVADGRGVNYADRPFVRQALATKSLAVGGYRVGPLGGQPGIALARPVFGASKQVVGLCVLSLRLPWFTDIFAKSRVPDACEACLFDDRGIALATWPDNARRIGQALPDVAQALARHAGDSDVAWTGPGPDGSPFYFVATTVWPAMPNRLHLRLGLPARKVTGPLDQALRRDLALLGLSLALALLAAHLFSRTFLLRPVRQLAGMAKAVAQGDLDRRSGIGPGHGEMTDLGWALDAMADTLRERIRFTQELIDAIPAPVFYKTPDGRYIGCNKTYEDCIRPLREIQGKTARDFVLPEMAKHCEETDRETLASPHRTTQFETKFLLRDGTEHDLVFFKSTFNNASGAPAGIIGVALDITTRKRSERALFASETKYRAVLASMRDGFAVASQDDRIVESNPAYREMLGYSAEELSRLTYKDFTPAVWHDAQEAIYHNTVDKQGFSDVFEKEYRRKDGTVFPVALRLHRYPAPAGDACRYFAIVRDITAVKAIEADLRRAKETAETANRAKSDFLAKMSHDIRTPLNAVIGMTELTLGTELSPPQRDALETVRESAATLLELINDILDISRIEASKLEPVRETFDLRRTLAGSIRTLRPQARRKGLSLTLSIAPQTPRFVTGDQGRLRQILMNLIGNGLKFTGQGGVALAVRPGPRPDKQDGPTPLLFTVADTGIGIPAEKLEGIFEMFAQADTTIASQYGGTGLGLAICRELARLMGGTIDAQSVPGQGSVFQVTLPLPRGEAPGAPAAAQQAGPPHGPQRPLRILLAEDNPVNVKVASAYLSRRGHDFLVAPNGRQALELLAGRPFDVVLMDVEMPEIDGLEATRRLRAGQVGPVNQGLPVVAMTAHALNGAQQRCLEAGMTAYLSKPLDFQALDALLARMADASRPLPVSQAPLAAHTPDLDTPKALSRLGGDAQLLRELQNDFLRQYPRKLRQITLCSRNENWSEASLAAHSLRNIAGAVGAETSRLLAGRLEGCLRSADADTASEILSRLKASLQQAANTIKTEQPATDPPPDQASLRV